MVQNAVNGNWDGEGSAAMFADPAARAAFLDKLVPFQAAIGVGLLGTTLPATQWVGFASVVVSVTALAWHERVRPERAVVTAPKDPVPV